MKVTILYSYTINTCYNGYLYLFKKNDTLSITPLRHNFLKPKKSDANMNVFLYFDFKHNNYIHNVSR